MADKAVKLLKSLFVISIIFFTILLFINHNSRLVANNLQIQNKKNDYSLLISVEDNCIYLLKGGKPIKSFLCATGKAETPSPLGLFKIIKKSRWGEGFGGSWMSLNCTWGTYGIHGTIMPETVGYPLSHGCFRMFISDAEELYNIVPVGTPVFISGGCYGPFGNGFRPIGPGMYGLDVKTIQLKLKKLGFYNGSCNGSYNANGFEEAVHHFQEENGIIISDTITHKMFEKMGFVLMD
jgi:hypothetical protein